MINALYISYDGATDPLGQAQVLPYLEGLSENGIRFALLTFEKNPSDHKELIKILSLRLEEKNISWVRLTYHKRPPVISTLFDIFCGVISGIALVRKRKINIVHARSYVAALIAVILKKMFHLKFIFDMRGFWADERVEGRIWKKKGVLYWIVKRLENKFLKEADEVIVLTQEAKTILKEWGYLSEKISVVPCCTDTSKFKLPEVSKRESLRRQYNLEEKFIFVHTGSLEYWYMKEEMLDYFKAAKEMIPNAHFLILTRYNKDKIVGLILDKKLDLADFSFVSAEFSRMPDMLSMADAGLIFITPVFSKRASSPTKFAEYLACGLPVIINDRIGDMESYVVKNKIGVVVKEFNDGEYRRSFTSLLSLLQDKNLSQRCRDTADREFDLKVGVERYSRVYARLK